MERTLSDTQYARLPTPAEKETLQALTVGCISCFMGAPLLADVDRIVTAVDWGDGALTIAAQPATPCNITAVLTDANDSVTAGILTITGVDPMGRTVVETLDLTDGKTLTGTKIFASVTSAVISGTAGTVAAGTDQVTVGVGNVIGLPMDLTSDDEVMAVWFDNTFVPIASLDAIATGESTSGINYSSGTYDGTKLMWCMVRPSKNA